MIGYIKIWHLLLAALAIRVGAYFFFNIWIFNNEFQHPDSYLYHYISTDLKELWSNGEFVFSRYPEYTNITALLYFLPIPERLGPEILNILASTFTALIGYKTVERIGNLTAAKITGVVLAIDPYMVYLSTQYLRDSLILLSLSLIVYSLTIEKNKTLIISTVALTLLRSIQAIALAPLILLINPKIKSAAISLAVISVYIILSTSVSYGIDLTTSVPIPPNANTTGDTHIEFFDNPGIQNIPYNEPWKRGFQIFNPLLYAEAFQIFITFPYPWSADTPIEAAFAGYMLYWYLFVALGTTGLIGYLLTPGQVKISRNVKLLALWGIVLGTILVVVVGQQGPLVRWRLQPYYLMIPAISMGVSYLMNYDVRRRVLDILVCISSLVALMIVPVIPAIMIVLLLTPRSGRKIFFKQERVGYQGKHFFIHKFVTMVPDSDGVALSNDDPRLTKVGAILRKTALDEIPEIWNIIKGDMSVVGPRPLAYWEDDQCKEEIPGWEQRYQVMPGLTGLAQLRIKRENNPGKLDWDMEYINNRSTRYDMWIFYRGALNNLTGKWH